MIGLLMLVAVTIPSGAYYTGDELNKVCQSDPAGACLSYLAGVSDERDSLQGFGEVPRMICIPRDRVTTRQLRDMALKYLGAHPESRQTAAASVVSRALYDAFPCPNKAV